MKTKELIRFIQSRAKSDTPLAFVCRLARFVLIAIFIPMRSRKTQGIFTGYVLREIQGSKMYLDLQDKGLSTDLLLDGIREPLITKAIQKEIKSTDVCIDIGANIGYYVLQEARIAKTVYAIEPVKENIELLMKNIEANKYDNIVAYQLACGSESKQDYINVATKRNLSSMVACDREYTKQQLIQVVTLDEFVKEKPYPDFIRMDVEGYEYEIIQGMKEILDARRPLKIFIEFHFDLLRDKTLAIVHRLEETGFRIKVATVEPHPAIAKSPILLKIAKLLEQGIGAKTGYVDISMDDLITDKKYRSGQVEWMEILFVR